MKIIIVSLLGLNLCGLAYADEKTGELKTSATMQATCTISTDSINMGVISTPLMSQTAQSEMNVLCNNGSQYTIDLAYGGIYGQGAAAINYNVTLFSASPTYSAYVVRNKDGDLGLVFCHSDGSLMFDGVKTATAYGYKPTDAGKFISGVSVCTGKNIKSNTLSVAGTSYDYGVMRGAFKSDSLAYSIALPGNSNKVWNAGNNSYVNTGTGIVQTIPLFAKIVPDKSGSKYPAPDIYLDTITAVISY